MQPDLQAFIDRQFEIPSTEIEDKRLAPEAAIERFIEPGMSLYLPCGAALLNPLIRRFWGQDPAFTIITTGVTLQLHAMIHGGLVKKAITSFAGHTYPSPKPCRTVQKAVRKGRLEIENWSIRTLIQRLLAAALGLGFLPTRSLIGSSMATENAADFKTIEAPFDGGGPIGLVRALVPDVALMHAAACDRSGNALFTYPLIGDAYGAWAARNGVIISTEKIVTSNYVREHAHMVRIPSRQVLAVCEAPFGLHPYGVTQHGLPGYAHANFPDYRFQTELMQATENDAAFSAWIDKWILGLVDHEDYLRQLGAERLLYLRGKSAADAWCSETASQSSHMNATAPANPLEILAVVGSRVIADRCRQHGYDSLLAGIGMANLCAWLAHHQLKKGGHRVDLLAEVGMAGYHPRPSDPTAFSYHNNHSAKFLSNIETILGYLVGGASSRCMGILGAGQIDAAGNVNATKIPGVAHLVGSGGANDVAATSREAMVVMTAGRDRLVPRVPYVTFPGDRVRTLVTDLGVFEKNPDDGRFILTVIIKPEDGADENRCIEKIRANVGWELNVSPRLEMAAPPSQEELTLLRLFDPERFFIGK